MELFKEVKQIYTFCKRQGLNFEKVWKSFRSEWALISSFLLIFTHI